MFIAFVLISLIWCWFYFGLIVTCSIALCFVMACLLTRKKLALLVFTLSAIIIYQLELSIEHVLPRFYQHQEVALDVCITQPLREYSDGLRSGIGSVVEQPDNTSLRKIKLSIPEAFGDFPLIPGHCINGFFRVKQPTGRIIPSSFNTDKYNFSSKIDAYGTLVDLKQITSRPSFIQSSYNRVSSRFQSNEALQAWAALTLGWSYSMSSELKTLLSKNQIMHLFVISGMHIGFISLLVYGFIWLSSKPFSRFFVLSFTHRAYITFGLVLIYVSFIGFPVPATRSLLMGLIPIITLALGYKTSWYFSLSMSAILIAVIFPVSWLSIGTWLSYSSVLIIILIYRWRLAQKKFTGANILTFQFLMSSSVLPWSFLIGFPVNIFATLVNLIVAPVVTFFVLPLSFLILVFNSKILVGLFELSFTNAIKFLGVFDHLGFVLPNMSYLFLLLLVLIIVLLVWYRSLYFFVFSIFALVSITTLSFSVVKNQKITEQLTVFDVGHGQAILIETNEGNWLYDTGGRISDELSVAELYLSRSLPSLAGIIVSHADVDHSGGFEYIYQKNPGARLYFGQPDLQNLKSPNRPIENCHDQRFLSAAIEVLPIPESLKLTNNDHSCVIVVTLNNQRIIITGDAGRRIEYYLMQTYRSQFPFDSVVLGHHGSATSSAADWLNLNAKANFLLSTSDRARPKWPAPIVKQWFEAHKLAYLSTAEVGSIQLNPKSKRIELKTWDTAYRKRLIY